MKQPTQQVGLACHSSGGKDPVISSHARLSGHFTSCTKKIKYQTEDRRKERPIMNLRTADRKKVEFVTFFGTLCVCMYAFGYHKCIVKLPTATKDAGLSLVIVFTAQCPVSDFTAPCPGFDCKA